MKDIKTLLDEEIVSQLEVLHDMPVDSENFKPTVDEVVKLVDRSIEMEKLEVEREERIRTQKSEVELRLSQLKHERIDRWIGHGINVLGIVTSVGLTYWGVRASFEFEKEGTVTTIAGRGFLNQLVPKLRK